MLVLLQFLDSPFTEGLGGLRPVAMERALVIIEEELAAAGLTIQARCDARGNAT